MPFVNGKLIPDYQLVDGFRVGRCFSPEAVRDTIKVKPKAGDIFLATFPKCGTTWTQQILLLLKNDAKPCANSREFLFGCPYLEYTGVDLLEEQSQPRLAKIHLPFHLAPYSAEAKYIFIVRNPKDCLVSFFHHTRTNFYDFAAGDFNDYFELFLNGDVDYGDYFDHVLSWYERRNDPNVLFLYYENMKKDITTTIKEIASFLGPKYEQLVATPDKLADVVKYSSFEYMRAHIDDDMGAMFGDLINCGVDLEIMGLPLGVQHIIEYLRRRRVKAVDDFRLVRKGIVGDWRANFSEDQNDRMNEKIERKLGGTEMLELWKSMGCL